jgi:hypothetical protein
VVVGVDGGGGWWWVAGGGWWRVMVVVVGGGWWGYLACWVKGEIGKSAAFRSSVHERPVRQVRIEQHDI